MNCFHGSWQWEHSGLKQTAIIMVWQSLQGEWLLLNRISPKTNPEGKAAVVVQQRWNRRRKILSWIWWKAIVHPAFALFFGGETVKCCSGTKDIPWVRSMVACGISPEDFMILGFTLKLCSVLWRMKKDVSKKARWDMTPTPRVFHDCS